MSNEDYIAIISELNGLKSFQDFWSIESSLLTSADVQVFQARYNITEYKDVHDNKFIYLGRLTEEELFIIENERIPYLTNPLIKGLYCDVLTHSIKIEAYKYADESIRCYLEVLSHYSAYNEQIVLYVLFGCTLSIISYNKDKSLLNEILPSFFNDSTISARVKRVALRFISASKYFKAIECQAIIDSDDIWSQLSYDYIANQRYFTLLLRIAQAANKPVEYKDLIYHRLAENEDIILSQNPLNVCAVKGLKKKADYLESGHFYEEAIECRKMISVAKKNRESVANFQYNIMILSDFINPLLMILQETSYIFEVLATDERLLPNKPIIENDPVDDIRLLGIRYEKTDDNGNPHQNPRDFSLQLNTYYNAYQLYTFQPIMISLRKLIEKKIFSYRNLVNYLKKSWLGKPRIQVNADLYESNESWLDNLIPSLKILCRELSKEATKENYKGDYVCSLDSLTIKLEGCLRDIARIKGMKTIDENNNEILLDGLLKQFDESIMPRKTILLLNEILNYEGINLRNKYAHGFSSLADYNIKNAFMLLHCLLRISAVEL